ncbi:AAA family ATPase [Lachnotalea sp. AF33-28]|jgi:MoxR-like ATPase|uniref:AAA family ATPase n=1 Tax=Lachnotalea sp. AF33-28 TaxID=2292046 RepID=UPI000E53DFD4|nr:MoxR family ATPase [Lachnotalea sp. AF33-28]RHP31938.1 MoxR family ATPase [Lachnotalea sp. AF33-28]
MPPNIGNASAIINEVKKAVVGKEDKIEKILMAILACGHILLEDVPGVGKTTMALAFSRAMGLSAKRLQFTPDVLPSDVIGYYMYHKETQSFRYHEGAVNCNVFLADEINRTSPKTQSALLEAMEERQISIEGRTFPLPDPFTVLATQNPIGSIGTQRLPESQMDRFMICLSMGYPDKEAEIRMMQEHDSANPLEQIDPVVDAKRLTAMQQEVKAVYIHRNIYDYIASLAEATRKDSSIVLGLSPRGSLALCRMAKAAAYMNGRDYAVPEDVISVFYDVAGHRMILDPKAQLSGITRETVLRNALRGVKKPKGD